MSQIKGPVRTYRNNLMDTAPGEVVVTDKNGTRIVAVDAPKLPTFENYTTPDVGSFVTGADKPK